MAQNNTEKKPLTRFGEFELLKAIAILGLPAVHVLEEAMEGGFASPGLMRFGFLIIGLCAFGPSVFMICMGFGIGGGRQNPDSILRNGIQFLLIGAILNIFRWLIPGIIQDLIIHTPLINDINFCLQSDIYYFVGIFFVFYSFLLRLKIKTPGLVMISVITLTINTILTPILHGSIKNPTVACLLGNLVYVDETSCFPLLSWAIFPTVGILLGEMLKKSDEEQRENFMKRIFDFSAVLFISFTVFLWNYHIDIEKSLVSPANEYITDLPNVILLLSLALFLISLTYYLCKKIGASKFMGFMLKISAFIIPFYMVQWIIIAWIFYILTIVGAAPESFGGLHYAISVLIVTVICIYVATRHGMKIMKLLIKFTTFKKKKKKKDNREKKA
ncbi:MAG: hypothetical protein IKQ71_01530 [Lachnospiraceae bacterium]|nr:hypothetical protein [Lachnospiraceae bacterium]